MTEKQADDDVVAIGRTGRRTPAFDGRGSVYNGAMT
jgi:hypothetical protein